MTYTFHNSNDSSYYIFDTASGSVLRANELEAYICDALDPCGDILTHLPEKCPSDVRYELARFSSTEVTSAYEKIKQYFQSGLIFGTSANISLKTSGEHSADKDLLPFILSETGLSSDEITFIN